MKLVFQPASNKDLEAIITVAKHTIDQSYRYFLTDDVVKLYLNSPKLDKYLKNESKNTWTIIDDDRLLGFAICIENIIDFMMIDVKYHRQGYGSKLLNYCEEMLFEKYGVIALESFEDNKNATEFYTSNGWMITEKYIDLKANATKLIFRKNKEGYAK